MATSDESTQQLISGIFGKPLHLAHKHASSGKNNFRQRKIPLTIVYHIPQSAQNL
jgi:molybdopterin-biosynthesis enzyme MoeA-like protein